MKTQVLSVDSLHPEEDITTYAASLIQQGKLVAFPTETVYGLGANALDAKAVSHIFAAKNRPSDNPVIVHIAKLADVETFAKNIPPITWEVAKAFWPGPLTILLEKKEIIPHNVTAGSSLVSLRIPHHPVAIALLEKAKLPIAAPSANSSTKPSPTEAQHVLEDLNGKVDLILDAGPTSIGVESTVLDVASDPPAILRPGGISLEDVQKIIPSVYYYHRTDAKPRAPGMKYKHYAPSAEIILFIGDNKLVDQKIISEYQEGSTEVISDTPIPSISANATYLLKNDQEYARHIFALFRNADKKGIKKILIKGIAEKGLGAAVMNRLKKAATAVIFV